MARSNCSSIWHHSITFRGVLFQERLSRAAPHRHPCATNIGVLAAGTFCVARSATAAMRPRDGQGSSAYWRDRSAACRSGRPVEREVGVRGGVRRSCARQRCGSRSCHDGAIAGIAWARTMRDQVFRRHGLRLCGIAETGLREKLLGFRTSVRWSGDFDRGRSTRAIAKRRKIHRVAVARNHLRRDRLGTSPSPWRRVLPRADRSGQGAVRDPRRSRLPARGNGARRRG